MTDDVNVLVTDLDFGHGISSGPLLRRMAAERPWVPLVVLTSHLSPHLAVSDAQSLPDDLVYVVKSRLRRTQDIADAVADALAGSRSSARPSPWMASIRSPRRRPTCCGCSRAVSRRKRSPTSAAPRCAARRTMINRLYAALGIADDESTNPRVEAVRLWQQGGVRVR